MSRLTCPHCPATRANEAELKAHIREHIKDLSAFVEEDEQ